MSDVQEAPRQAETGRARRRSLLPLLLIGVGVLAVVIAAVGLLSRHDTPTAQPSPVPPVTTSPAASPPASSAATPKAHRSAGFVPTALVIPALGVNVPVIPIAAQGSTLVPPNDPQEIGWWRDGARPGATTGSALLTGHTVHTGGGALDHLGTLAKGQALTVRTHARTLHYVAVRVRDYAKGTLARDAKRLFDQTVPGRLVVVTCSDWNGTEYLSNTVVTARLVG